MQLKPRSSFCGIGVPQFIWLLAASTLMTNVDAQSYPSRPITVIMPFGAGPTFDVFARALTGEASKLIGQPIVYENQPGANGRRGISAIKAAKPDGYIATIVQDVNIVAQPIVNPDHQLEVEKDYIPVAVLFDNVFALFASKSVPFRDVKGLVAYAKANPGKLNFAVTPGSVGQVVATLLESAANIQLTQVPYRQPTQIMADVLEGRADLMAFGLQAIQHAESGKLVAIASFAKERWKPMPNLPTMLESGVPLSSSAWYTLIVSAGTPRDAVEKLAAAFNGARKLPAMQRLYESSAFNPMPYLTPEEIAKKIREQIRSDGPALLKAGIKLE